jgi:hypothetical protein
MGVKIRDLKGDGNAWIVIYSGNKRRQRKIGDWDEARRLAKEIEAAQLRIKAGLPEPLPLSRVLAGHRDGYVKTLKQSTQVLQRGQIDNHLIPVLGEIDARDLNEAHMTAFIEKSWKHFLRRSRLHKRAEQIPANSAAGEPRRSEDRV